MTFKRFSLFVGIILPSTSWAAATTKFSSLVVFGDSFTDNGNGSYTITNGTWPLAVYDQGRFSNGPVWAENVASNLSIPLYDYAYGGATTSNVLVQGYTGAKSDVAVPGIAEQVDSFLKTNNTSISFETTLFALLGGFNDIFFNTNLTSAQIAASLSGSLTKLVNAGAQHILLLHYYDATQIPYDTYADPVTKEVLLKFSEDYPKQLSLLASGFRQQLAGKTSESSLTYVDFLPLYRSFYYYGTPTKYGFKTLGAYGSCLTGAYGETANITQCSDPDKMVFWDEYHPSGRTHQIMADYILSKL
ncbi:GDSL-like Lipase/Acylhydrolase [Microthyrium microscopicum]|uniref:GDSL-like Lipase/Acylhydrolase n=1 Tax=Microthyrium microscopicum TaxID=703497 RepID=A0A6A6UFY6_9PEZI|nr:GDSL-like Lipase/Acylhydrolase [Microthyrium microscopicum]